MRDFVVGFEGWFEVENGIDEEQATSRVLALLDKAFAPLAAAGGSVTVVTDGIEVDGLFTYVDFQGHFDIRAEGDEEAFDLGFALMGAFVSPLCQGGEVGDWEIGEVEEAGASKVPA